MLTIENARKTFRKNGQDIVALAGQSLTLAASEFVAVRGPSGSGKTTLLLIAGGLLRPDSGTISINGENLYGLAAGARTALRARMIGFVFQQYHLAPYLTVKENILAPTMARPVPDADARAETLADQFGIRHRLAHRPGELSAGEKQRVAFARALLGSPSLLFADEPTGNLDATAAALILDAMRRFANDGGAVLMATHSDSAASKADRSITMKTDR